MSAEKRKRPILQINANGEIVKIWKSARDCQNETGYFESNVNKCCNGVIKTYKGYVWEYAKTKSVATWDEVKGERHE